MPISTVSTTTSPVGGNLPTSTPTVGGIVLDLIGSNGQRVIAYLGAATLYQDVSPAIRSQTPEIVIGTQEGLTSTLLAGLGGGISQAAIRITLFDGDTSGPKISASENQDFNQNTLLLNDINFGNWSTVETATTDSVGNKISTNTSNIGFFNNELDTGWFSTNDSTILSGFYTSLVNTGKVVYKLLDSVPGDNYRSFQQGLDASTIDSSSSTPNVKIVPLNPSNPDTTITIDFTPAFNRDVIVNTNDSVQDPINDLQQDFVTQSVATLAAPPTDNPATSGKGLPDNGFFPANAFHPAIQLAYRNTDNGNNAWVATSNGQGVNLDIPDAKYSEIHVAAAATDGAATMQATLIYTDGTQAIATADVPDWQDELTAQSPSAYYLIDAMDTAQPNGTFAQADDPALFGFRFTPDPTRTLQSVTLTKTGGAGTLNVFGATGVKPAVTDGGGGGTDGIIVGGGGTGTSAITRQCKNGTPLSPFPAKFFNPQEVIRLDNTANVLGLNLPTRAPKGQPRVWQITESNSPQFVRRFNRQSHNSRAGYRIFGRKGNDVVSVTRGQNVLYGNGGNDTLTGGGRRDVLYGNAGDDVLNGNIGRDILVGGGGDDTLTGGARSDMFVYNTIAQGTDLIKDFTPALDVLDLRKIFKQDAFQVAGQSIYQRLNQFVRLVETGGNTQVQIDANGKGAGQTFNTLAVLEGVSLSQLTSCNFVV